MTLPVTNSTTVTTLSNAEKVAGLIADLQERMSKALPGYESLLFQIHQNLMKDDSTVHLLTPEQVGVIVAGLSKKTGIVLAEGVSKSKAKKNEKVTLADL